MASINKYLVLFLFPLITFGDSDLPLLFTKQPLRNVRYISSEGKYTYFQNSTGQLLLSTNYQAKEILKGGPGSNFLMIASNTKKYMLFTIDEHYHDFYGIREPLKIYKLRYGKTIPELIGLGQFPGLHLSDTWATFYNFQEKVIHFQNLFTNALKFKIILNNPINPYFNPQVAMLDKETVLFSDLNDQGIPGILIYNRADKKSSAIYKGTSVREKIEFCIQDDHLIVGHFGIDRSKIGSKVIRYPLKGLKFEDKKELYTSKKNDIGNLICNRDKDAIYFIQNLSENKKTQYEAVKLEIPTGKITTISDVGHANQIIPMDDKLLLPFRGKVYVIKGKATFKSDSFAEKKKESKK